MAINRYDIYTLLDDELDDLSPVCPFTAPKLDEDEYDFIPWSLERWHDRAFKPHWTFKKQA